MARDRVRPAPTSGNGKSDPAPAKRRMEGSDLSPLDPSLSVLQRILLTTDGTVTHILEAYARETLEVAKLSQSMGDWRDPDSEDPPARPEKVLRRSILLRGTKSRTNFLYAKSLIMANRLDPSVRLGLILTNKSIGKLLVENRTETFRDIVSMCREPAGAQGAYFGIDATAPVISRTYHVVARQRPIMTITEKFPTTAFL